MGRTLWVRADEVSVGDTVALAGLVGTVTEVLSAGSHTPHVAIRIVTDWGFVAREVYRPGRRVCVSL